MKIPRITRRWKVFYHLRSGQTITQVVRALEIEKRYNELTKLTSIGQKSCSLDFILLDSIEAITSRKAWSFYITWE